MPYKRCCRISIVLAFSFGRAKTIGVRYVWTRIFSKTEKKNLENIRVHVDRASVVFNSGKQYQTRRPEWPLVVF